MSRLYSCDKCTRKEWKLADMIAHIKKNHGLPYHIVEDTLENLLELFDE